LLRINPAGIAMGTDTSLRVFVALFGIAIVPLTYGILYRLTRSRLSATIGGLIVMLNGILIIISRFVLTDSILICFGLAAIYAALRWRENYKRLGWLIAAALFAGIAGSIKWTGLTALFMVLVIFAETSLRHIPNWAKRLRGLGIIIVLSSVIYLGAFWLHFALLTKTGQGDPFMPTKFQSTLVGNPDYSSSALGQTS
jgi:dolichyl-phosphate-mannose-protein mannosyltransferase